MKKLEDGSLRIVGSNGDNGKSGVWESTDAGKTWKSVYDLPAEVQDQENGWMDYAAISPGGQVVCVFNEIVSGGGGFHPVFYLLDKQGKTDKMSFELPQNEGKVGSAVNKSVEVGRAMQSSRKQEKDSRKMEALQIPLWTYSFRAMNGLLCKMPLGQSIR